MGVYSTPTRTTTRPFFTSSWYIFKSNDFTCFVWLVQKPEAGYKKGQNDLVKVCLLPIAKMFIAIRSGAWKREKYTRLDGVFSLVQIKVGMSKSQVRRCVIIVYLLSFFITSGASKNWPKRSPILTKINWTKFRVRAVPRRAKCSHIFFPKNSTMPSEMYITQTLCVVQPKFRWRTTTLPITFSHALLFSISDSALTHNCFFFCLPRSKKKTCLGQQYNHEGCRSSVTRNKRWTQCLKNSQNVAFEFFNFGTNFWHF